MISKHLKYKIPMKVTYLNMGKAPNYFKKIRGKHVEADHSFDFAEQLNKTISEKNYLHSRSCLSVGPQKRPHLGAYTAGTTY